jgi:CRP-like cAMP-binding protein
MSKTTSYTEQLRALPLFQALTPHEFDLLQQHLRPLFAGAGEILFEEGDPGRSCYIIVTGEIGVYKQLPGHTGTGPEGRSKVATLEPGAMVGHMALIDNKPRSATCKVETGDTLLLELGREEFEMLFTAKTPFAFKIIDRLAIDLVSSLRRTTALLQKAHREQNRAKQVEVVMEASRQVPGSGKA